MPLRFKGLTSAEIQSQTPKEVNKCCIDERLWQFMSGMTLQSALDIFESSNDDAASDVIEVAKELRCCLVGRPKSLRSNDLLADVYYKISASKRDKFLGFVLWQYHYREKKRR